MNRASSLWLVMLAGCPPMMTGPAPTGGAQPVEAQVGCPVGSDVYVATYLGGDASKPGSHAGWVLPLRDEKVESLNGVPEFSELPPAAAGSAAFIDSERPTKPIWILQPNQPPCRTVTGKPYRAAVDIPNTPNLSYGVELDGCTPPNEGEDDEAIALASMQSPGQCQIIAPHPVAARLGEPDAKQQWTRPTKATAIPPELDVLVPQHACVAPDCEKLWSFLRVDYNNTPVVWSGAVNWLQVGALPTPNAVACHWPVEKFSGFFVPAAGSGSGSGALVKVEGGQDHPLVLAAVLADRSGPRVLVADGVGEYSSYDLGAGSAGGATLAHQVTWLVAEPKAYEADDRLGPVCE